MLDNPQICEKDSYCDRIKRKVPTKAVEKRVTLAKNDEQDQTDVAAMKQRDGKTKITSRSANSLFLLLRTKKSLCVLAKQWIVMCVLFSCVSAREQKFAIEPQDQSAVVGSRVTLPCRVVNKAGQLQWTKDDFGLGTHRHLTGYQRYKMIGSDEEGDFSLDIREVTLDDDALYQCQVSSGPKGEPPIRSRYARLLVLAPPEPPKILQGKSIQAVEDREVDLECVSMGGKPAAEITWVDQDGGVLTQDVTYNIEPASDGRRYTARSVLRLRPRRHHHDQTFTCQAQNTADRAYRSTSIKIQVQYAPKVRIFLKSKKENKRISEGENIAIGCQATANPNDLAYKWFINNDQIVGATNELVIANVSRHHNEATVRCEVFNSVGKSADTLTLEVSYGPSFLVKPQNVQGEAGSTVTIHCVVDGHPPPKTIWLRYENERIVRVGKSSNLTVTISQQSAGQYWCRGMVDGYQDIEAPAVVYVKGPPKILSNQTQYGAEGSIVRVECISFSIPKPEYVLWSFAGSEINSFLNQEYAFLEESLSDGMTKSTLIIRESKKSHFGTYNCSVTNMFGTDSIAINLLPEKSFPLILIASGCSSFAILILIVLFIVMLCNRRTKKGDSKKPDITELGKKCDQFKESDRSSNISDMKLELKQVDGWQMECSEAEFHSNLHLTTNLGLPLAGPVNLPDAGHDNELMKHQRYSGDFNQAITSLHLKNQSQSNGYVPYVDYANDYAPPDSVHGSLSRSINGPNSLGQCGSLHRQASCGRLGGTVGPDLIPMGNPGVLINTNDARFAATYGNPYLRGSSIPSHGGANQTTTHAPPPYYTLRSNNLPLPANSSSPSSTSSSRQMSSPLASSSSTVSGAQPQVPKVPPLSGSLYVLPPSSQGTMHANQITTKGNGSKKTPGTHV